MSEYLTVQLNITDQDCLIKALNEMGYQTIEVHETAQPLVGFQGDVRTQKAHIIVRREHVGSASNDVGFIKTDSGYQMIISEYDKRHAKKFTEQLNQMYSKHRVIQQARAIGYTVTSQTVEEDGRLRLRLMTR
jgi:hypothetical protein